MKFSSISCEIPDFVQINALSVNPKTNYIEFFWTPFLEPNIRGYVIFEGLGAGSVDTIWGAEQNSFTLQRAADTSLRFELAAINQCLERGGKSRVRQVFMCKAEQLPCRREIEISWSDAIRSVSNINHFEIWVSRNGEDFVNRRTVDASQDSAIVNIPEAKHEDEYKIFVRAVSSDSDTIFANSIASDMLRMIIAPEPEFAYLRTVSVIDDETVEIRAHVDVSVVWESLFAYVDDSLAKTIIYDDFLKNNRFLLPRKEHAFYHFQVSDTCGEIVILSNDAKPILLEAGLHGTTVELTFSEYYGWSENDIHYDVFEIQDGDTTLKFGPFLPNEIHQFTISNPEQILSLSYYVKAYGTSLDGIKDTTQSNVVEVINRDVRFPNIRYGFVLGGISKYFRPFYVLRPNDQIRFEIRNKFGQIVYSISDPIPIDEEWGWDGTFNNNGIECQPGVYLFLFEVVRNNKTTRERGTVTLIR